MKYLQDESNPDFKGIYMQVMMDPDMKSYKNEMDHEENIYTFDLNALDILVDGNKQEI